MWEGAGLRLCPGKLEEDSSRASHGAPFQKGVLLAGIHFAVLSTRQEKEEKKNLKLFIQKNITLSPITLANFSRLLTSSLSLGIPVPRATQCM
jgi:hypothetical protein